LREQRGQGAAVFSGLRNRIVVILSGHCISQTPTTASFIHKSGIPVDAEVLTVLTVIWLPGEKQRIISFRRAHKYEREAYHAWLEEDFTD